MESEIVADGQFDVFECAADLMAKQLAFFREEGAEPNENDRLTAGHLAGALWANKLLVSDPPSNDDGTQPPALR